MDDIRTTYAVPVIALRGLVVFPEMVLHFDIARKKSIDALNAAMDYSQEVFLVTQKDPAEEEPGFDGLFSIGCMAQIRQVLTIPNSDHLRVIVEGTERARVLEGMTASSSTQMWRMCRPTTTPRDGRNMRRH